MAYLFPRVAFAPARCAPIRHEVAPLWSLFDDTFNELQRASRQARKSFNPRFDVKEGAEAYSLEGELPGVDQKDLSIEFTDEHTLTIKGRTERHVEKGNRPQAIEEQSEAALENTAATPASEAESVRSHQPTVEDEDAPATETKAVEKAEPTQEPAKAEEQPKEQKWISERHVGEFTRSFSFPSRVDQEAVKASLKNGILSIVVPKAAAPASRRINIE